MLTPSALGPPLSTFQDYPLDVTPGTDVVRDLQFQIRTALVDNFTDNYLSVRTGPSSKRFVEPQVTRVAIPVYGIVTAEVKWEAPATIAQPPLNTSQRAVVVFTETAYGPGSGMIQAPAASVSLQKRAIVYSSITQVCTNNALTVLSWDTAISNPDGIWSPSQPTRFVAAVAGLYIVGCEIALSADAAGSRQVGFHKNGTVIIAAPEYPSYAATFNGQVFQIVSLAAGDYVEAFVYVRGAGGNVTGQAATALTPYLATASMLGPY